jgi:hypothetical protein
MPLSTPQQQTESFTPLLLTRPSENSLDYSRLAHAQRQVSELMEETIISSLRITIFQLEGKTLHCDVSFCAVWPLILDQNGCSLFQQILGIAHTGNKSNTETYFC